MLACDRATVRAEEAALGRTHAEVHLRAAREELELVAASALGAHHRAWMAKGATTLGRHRGAATGRLRVFSRARRAAAERARASGAMGAACAGMWGRGHVGARACGGFLRLRGRLGARGTLRVLRCPRASGARWSRAGRGPCMPCAGRVPWPPDPWMPRRVQTATAPEWSKEEESAAWGGQAQRPLPCLGGVGRRALFAGPGSGPGGSPCASGRASGADGCRTRRREPRALRACGAASRPDAARESTQRSSPLLHATAPPP